MIFNTNYVKTNIYAYKDKENNDKQENKRMAFGSNVSCDGEGE